MHSLDTRLRTVRLLDVYSPLLTEHQQRLMRLYYFDDLSLGEIAERLDVTRQAVRDTLQRATGELRRLEGHLKLLPRSAEVGR